METARLIAYAEADGPTNMAADEVLAETAAHGQASLRFYGWSEPTLSLGYFQPASARFADPLLASLPWVRRPSGGAALVHHHELTYALALPASVAGRNIACWLSKTHRLLADAIDALLGAPTARLVEEPSIQGDVLCFQKQTVGDVVVAGAKVVGSAQRKHRGSLVQHGSILLRRSPHAPALPGIAELTRRAFEREAIEEAFRDRCDAMLGLRLEQGDWLKDERAAVERLRLEKFASPAWNGKR